MELINPGWLHIALSRFPLKQIWDLFALFQMLLLGDVLRPKRRPLSLKKRAKCVHFYLTAEGIRRLYAAPPRAGSRWTQLGMAIALDLAKGGGGDYTFENNWFYPRDGLISRRLDWRIPIGETEQTFKRSSGPAFTEQLFLITHNPYFRLRCYPVREMKTVLVTRSILAVLESRYVKFANAPRHPEVTLDDENNFDWDQSLTRVIEFYNSWGDVLRWHPNIRHYKFEDLKMDTVAGFRDLLDFWDVSIPEDCIVEGFRRASKSEMQKIVAESGQPESLHVSARGSRNRGIISEERMRQIIGRLRKELVYDFGYKIETDTEYGIEYD